MKYTLGTGVIGALNLPHPAAVAVVAAASLAAAYLYWQRRERQRRRQQIWGRVYVPGKGHKRA